MKNTTGQELFNPLTFFSLLLETHPLPKALHNSYTRTLPTMSHYTLSLKRQLGAISNCKFLISNVKYGPYGHRFHWIGVPGHHGNLQIIGTEDKALLPIIYAATDGQSILVRLKETNPLLACIKRIESELQQTFIEDCHNNGQLETLLKKPVKRNHDYCLKLKCGQRTVIDPNGQSELLQGCELDRWTICVQKITYHGKKAYISCVLKACRVKLPRSPGSDRSENPEDMLAMMDAD